MKLSELIWSETLLNLCSVEASGLAAFTACRINCNHSSVSNCSVGNSWGHMGHNCDGTAPYLTHTTSSTNRHFFTSGCDRVLSKLNEELSNNSSFCQFSIWKILQEIQLESTLWDYHVLVKLSEKFLSATRSWVPFPWRSSNLCCIHLVRKAVQTSNISQQAISKWNRVNGIINWDDSLGWCYFENVWICVRVYTLSILRKSLLNEDT